ncbi:MAG: DUF2269 domain-containing protein [Alphaproteobacteria bacterium]
MDFYLWLKVVHVLGAAVLFGTGAGIAFFMWMAHLGGDVAVIHATARLVVIADFLFTLPAVVAQPLTGAWLVIEGGYAWSEAWLIWALALYVVIGACWIPVVFLQIRARDLAAAALRSGSALPWDYHRAMRLWFALGWPAFAAVIAIFVLMIFKP